MSFRATKKNIKRRNLWELPRFVTGGLAIVIFPKVLGQVLKLS
ncbi:hypothetical protein LEP1GSC163_3670 [Leptospira santarosai str. CBC379]|nr:hypothetical protein LEP1GSC163_3670 [Leptospira santarosai str. CBC379]